MSNRSFAVIAAGLGALSCSLLGAMTTRAASAADIKVLSAAALRPALAGLLTEFGMSSGHKVTINYGAIGALADRLQKGEAADVAFISPEQIENLQKLGRIVSGSDVQIAKVGIGMFVRKGGAKPDIGSVEAFRSALLAAKLIAYLDPTKGGPSGIYMAGLVERLGVAADIKSKTKLYPPGGTLIPAIANGEAEIGFIQISDILADPRVELVAALPAPIQNYTCYAAGLVTGSKQQDAGKSLITFISSPAAKAIMIAKGLE